MINEEKIALPTRFGKYLLVELIAVGGMAQIFKAKSYGVSGFEKTIVIKKILPSYAKNKDFIEMLIDEAKICASLQHTNIVQIHDLGRLEDSYFIAMEYVHGVDLVQVLARLRKAKHRLPVELVCHILAEALNGLDYAHRALGPDDQPLKIVHRDFNPSNILLSFQGDVKVADFGIAKAEDRDVQTMAQGLKGKMGYLSPEQVAGLPLDGRSDIFTAGITLWEMLTSYRMFSTGSELDILLKIRDAVIPDIRTYIADLPAALTTILGRALARDPAERFRTAAEFKEALEDYLFDSGVKITQGHLEGYLRSLFADKLKEAEERRATEKIDVTRVAPPRYWARRPGQKAVGPVEFSELTDRIAAGEVTRQWEVLREGEAWRSVSQVPELAAEFSLQPTQAEADPQAVPDYQGLIAEVSFPKLFYRLAIAKQNGRLVLTQTGLRKEIYFRQGMPEFVKSDMPSELLGEYLVAKKAITPEQRDQAVAAMRGFSGRLGDTLIGLGLLQPYQMFEYLQEQVKEKILQVFSWSNGTYLFFSGQGYTGEVMPLKIGKFALIAEGVRLHTQMEFLKSRFRPRMEQHAAKVPNPYLSLNTLGLAPREQRVVDSIDGKRTVRDLITLGGSDRGQFEVAAYRTLYILEELEMLNLTP